MWGGGGVGGRWVGYKFGNQQLLEVVSAIVLCCLMYGWEHS